MRRQVLLALAGLSFLVSACGTTAESSTFAQPNSLMGEEIDNRIAQIPFQHREDLVENLIWLTQTGEQAIPSIIEALQHENPKVRSNCAWVLGQMGDRRTIPFLQRMTNDEDPRVRLEVARTLVLMGDMGQTAVLIEGLDSERKEVRYMCHEALKTASRRDFGYDHLSADVMARNEAAYKWRQWWGEVSGDPYFALAYASEKGLTPSEGMPANAPRGMPAAPGGETAPQTEPPMEPQTQVEPGVQPNAPNTNPARETPTESGKAPGAGAATPPASGGTGEAGSSSPKPEITPEVIQAQPAQPSANPAGATPPKAGAATKPK